MSNNFRPQPPNYNRDGKRSGLPISPNHLRNVRNCFYLLLDQEQTDDTTSNTDYMDTQRVSKEQFLEQQPNGLLLELNQNTQNEYFNCQEEDNTFTEEYNFSTSSKSNICVLPLTIHTQPTLDHAKNGMKSRSTTNCN